MNYFDYQKVKDPTFFRDNRLDAHSDHVWYKTKEELEAEETSYRESLNGLWFFKYAPNYAQAQKNFFEMEKDCHSWNEIRVPAHIQMEGYDKPHYANIEYPWDGWEAVKPGEIPENFNPVANYVKYVEVPERMKGERIFISFQGVESAFALWVNGVYVGYAEDSFTPSEFELTDLLTDGENKIAVQVFKWSASSWCEDQDFFRFSGIYRDVYLYSIPKVHAVDVSTVGVLNDSLDQATLKLAIKSTGVGKVKASLYEEEYTYRFQKEFKVNKGRLASRKSVADISARIDGENEFSIPVEKPRLWSAEMPNLYTLIIEIYDEDDNLQELIPVQVGFRKFEMKDGIMLLNGKRIVFKGVNRHEFSCKTGRVPNEEELWQDLMTMKQNNINAIRTCHYPDDSRIYPLCDRLGLYMISECNLESHGSWGAAMGNRFPKEEIVPGNRPEWHDMMIDRATSMYELDKNHPAILIWSCGNEAFGGKNIFDMSEYFRGKDPYRLVHYEGIVNDRSYPDTSDMESQMYPSVTRIQNFLAENPGKPFICCEYTHAMGNSCGAMHKYTDLTDTEPRYQGGFIWDYVDQSILTKDRYGNEFQAYGGDFGDRPTEYNFSGNGIVYGDRTPSPKMQEVKFNYQNISVEVSESDIVIRNKNLFADTSDFDCFVCVEKEGKLISEKQLMTDVEPLSVGRFSTPFLLPGTPGEYVVTVSFRLKEDTAWAPKGHEIAFGQGAFQVGEGECPIGLAVAQKKPFRVERGWGNFSVHGENFEVLFSYSRGPVSYQYGGVELLEAIPKPNFWRAPVDNDCGNKMQARYGQWKLASMYGAYKPNMETFGIPEIVEEDSSVLVTYDYEMPTIPVTSCKIGYRVFGDGTIQVSLDYDPVEGIIEMPEFGMIFKLDADYDNVTWYGNGPEETYADRKHGAKLGVYQNKVIDNLAKYLVPQECGNKTDVRYAKVTDVRGRGILFAACDERHMNFSAMPWTPHEMENAMHAFELPPVHYTYARVALAQMGVGGDDSWAAEVHPEYLLPKNEKLHFVFAFKGI